MFRFVLLLVAVLLSTVSVSFAINGDLTVNGTLKVSPNGVKFDDGTVQNTAGFTVISAGTNSPNTNSYDIPIPPTTGRFNLTYTITPTADFEPIVIGFNDNLTATGTYTLYAVGTWPSASGKVHTGYGRTAAGSAGQYNNFDIIPAGNLISISGRHLSEANVPYWCSFFESYLKYTSPQTITKINIKCGNAGTKISSITWKIVTLP